MKKAQYLVRHLPSDHSSSKGRLPRGFTAECAFEFGKHGLHIFGLGPDGNFLHGVAVGDVALGEAVGLRGLSETIDCGDETVSVAEPGCVTSADVCGRIAAHVNA